MSIHLENIVIGWKKSLLMGFRLNGQSKHVESKKVGQAKMIQPLVPPRLQDEVTKPCQCTICNPTFVWTRSSLKFWKLNLDVGALIDYWRDSILACSSSYRHYLVKVVPCFLRWALWYLFDGLWFPLLLFLESLQASCLQNFSCTG